MEENPKLTRLARIMIDKHGEYASSVARCRAIKASVEPEVAVIWLRVADLAESYQSPVIPNRVDHSHLSEAWRL
jgi:hypothetical protein